MSRRLLALSMLVLAVSGCGGSSPSRVPQQSFPPPDTLRPTVVYRPAVTRLPVPVRDAAAAALPDGRVVLLGGLDAADVSTDAIELLTPDGRVESGARLPNPQHDAAAAAIGGSVYMFGGGDLTQYDHILRFDPATGRTTTVGRLPRAASDVAVAPIGGTAYVVGGYDGTSASAGIVAWRPGEATGRTVGHLPFAVRYAAVTAADGQLVIAGGTRSSGAASEQVFTFDPASGAVRRIGRLPEARTHAGAGTLLAHVAYVIGGYSSSPADPSSAVFEIDLRTGHVRRAARLPRPLSDLAAVTSGEHLRIVIAGGQDGNATLAAVGTLSLSAVRRP